MSRIRMSGPSRRVKYSDLVVENIEQYYIPDCRDQGETA